MSLFSGLSAFPATPTDVDGHVDAKHFSRLVERLDVDGIASIGVLGSTGGYVYLKPDERERAIAAAVDALSNTPVLAGVGALTTNEVIANANAAAKAGAKGLLLAPVSYLPLTDADVSGLVKDLAAATELPICLYNNPGTTKFNFSETLLAELSQISNVVAVKNPPAPEGDFSGQISRLRASTTNDFSLGYSGDAAISGALLAGCDAWYSVLGGTLPDLAIEIWNARSDPSAVARLEKRLAPLWKLFTDHGSIRVIYEVVVMQGLGRAQLPRPLLPLDANVCEEIKKALTMLQNTETQAA